MAAVSARHFLVTAARELATFCRSRLLECRAERLAWLVVKRLPQPPASLVKGLAQAPLHAADNYRLVADNIAGRSFAFKAFRIGRGYTPSQKMPIMKTIIANRDRPLTGMRSMFAAGCQYIAR